MATEYSYKDEVDARIVTWGDLDTGENGDSFAPASVQGVAGAVQVEGLSTSTLALQVSNDGTNWYTALDVFGSGISKTADGIAEFSTAARYIRPALSGGTDTGVVVTVVLRG